MSYNLLSLPPNEFDKICGFLDIASLLQLRSVSKSAKEHVETSLLHGDREYTVTHLTVDIQSLTALKIEFGFNRANLHHSKLFYSSVLNQLETPRFESCPRENKLRVTCKTDEVNSFFKFIKSFMLKTRVIHLVMHSNTDALTEIIFERRHGLQSIFLYGLNISNIHFIFSNGNADIFNSRACLARKINPSHSISCSFESITPEIFEFLTKIADNTNKIIIYCINYERIERDLNLKGIAREILSRRCERLYIETLRCGVLELEDAEKLIQYFQHLENKVSISAPTNDEHMRGQCGEYTVQITGGRYSRKIVIKHLEMD